MARLRYIFPAFIILLVTIILLWKTQPLESLPSSSERPSAANFSETTESNFGVATESTQTSSVVQASSSASKHSLEFAAPNIAPLLADAENRDRQKLPYRFATPLLVGKNSSQLAPWKIEGDTAFWELEVKASQASSLNFAFNHFYLPSGGQLSITSKPFDKTIVFTSRDNDDHGQLWTPVFPGEAVTLTASVPAILLSKLRLNLAAVNYGFRDKNGQKIGTSTSLGCNIDVVCGAGDLSFGDLIDAYRDEIRSVAAYTVNGVDTCTGALINNTREDNRPFFLTAYHCEVCHNSAPSVVVYWNFENSTCRLPGSPSSEQLGDGNLDTFNSGTIYRAGYGPTDFCLLELDDPVVNASAAYFSGWNRASTSPSQAVGIHHPSVAEKRISFEFSALNTTTYFGSSTTPAGNYFRVASWDQGTTEGGSSGSPLFDSSGKIVGQLHGGTSGCNATDWYGRISKSWEGGGTDQSRLSNWLDPLNLEPMSLDGRDATIPLVVATVRFGEGDSGNTIASVEFQLPEPLPTATSFDLSVAGGTATAGTDYLDPGTRTFTFAPNETSLIAEFTLVGDTQGENDETITLSFSNLQNVAPPLYETALIIVNDDFDTLPTLTSRQSAHGISQKEFRYQIEAINAPAETSPFSILGAPSGLQIDSKSGELSWPQPQTGTYPMEVIATNALGSSSMDLTIFIEADTIASGLDAPENLSFLASSNGWSLQTEETFDGQDAISLMGGLDNSSRTISTTINGPEEVTFWWKASTEYNADFFSVRLNGSTIASISGETGWHPQTVSIPAGQQTLSFVLTKDFSVDGGRDMAWVDRLTLLNHSPPTLTTPNPLSYPADTSTAFALSSFDTNSPLTITSLPPSWKFADDIISGTDSRSFSVSILASNANGDSTWSRQFLPFEAQSDLAVALDLPALTIKSSSNFHVQTDLSTNGSSAVRSGFVCSESSSEMTLYLIGPGKIEFDWRVSSEEGFDFGYLIHDGKTVDARSGETGWISEELELKPGLQEVRWLYLKDESDFDSLDGLFVDNIRLEGYAEWVSNNGMSPFSVPLSGGIDGDENPGLIEYAVGLSPTTAEASHILDFSRSAGISTLSTPLDSTAIGVTASIEKSHPLLPGSWNTLSSDTAPLGSNLSAQDSSGDEKAFYRLRVTSP